jgi:hypothetical protein
MIQRSVDVVMDISAVAGEYGHETVDIEVEKIVVVVVVE